MPPTEATENRIADALISALSGIGTPAPNWLTAPGTIAYGIPNDSLPATPSLQLYLQYQRTEEQDEQGSTATHRGRAHFTVWCVSMDSTPAGQRALVNLKADVLRALFAAEGTLQGSFVYGAWPDDFTIHEEMASAGVWAGGQNLHVDFEISHAAP